jgi:hypothetical protein
VTEPEQVTPAILAALRAVVEACEAICEKRYGCVNPGHTLEYKSAYQGSCYDIKQQIRREVGT